jgi:hypothetical protein
MTRRVTLKTKLRQVGSLLILKQFTVDFLFFWHQNSKKNGDKEANDIFPIDMKVLSAFSCLKNYWRIAGQFIYFP